MEDRLLEAQKIAKEYEENHNLSQAEELIKNNKISFDYQDKKYRVRLLDLSEKNELDTVRRKKFGQLIQDKDVLFEKDLVEQYKKRGVNIIDIDDETKKIAAIEIDLQIKLGKAIADNNGEAILNEYKKQLLELRSQKNTLFAQKAMLLEFSLENALLSYVAQIITYLSSDVLEDGKWKRLFNNFNEFEKYQDEKLIDELAQYSMLLQYN